MIYFTMIEDPAGQLRPAFFDDQIRARESIPADAVSLTAKRHAALMAATATGAAIVPCPKTGKPLLEHPVLFAASLRAALVRAVKAEAGCRIRATAPRWRQINDSNALILGQADDATKARMAQVFAIRTASGQIEDQIAMTAAAQLGEFPVETNPLWPLCDQGTD